MMAARPVADHGSRASAECGRDLVVVPGRKLPRRDAATAVQLGKQIRGPHALRAIERRLQIVVEQLTTRRDEKLVERSEQAGVAAGKKESVDCGCRHRGRRLDELVPRV